MSTNKSKVEAIRFQEFSTPLSPEKMYSNFSNEPYSALLCGNSENNNSKYAFIGINPFLTFKSKNDPFIEFQELIEHYSVKGFEFPMNLWGGIGYMSYDAAHHIEKLPKTTKDDLNMSVMQMVFYKDLIVFDLEKKKSYLVQVKLENEDYTNPNNILDKINKAKAPGPFHVKDKVKCCSKNKYIKKVKKIIDYIIKGDIYEVNLSHRCSVKYAGDTYNLFKNLYKRNSAPFSAYLPFGDHTIVSNSPERFIFSENGRIETCPIKGTAPRGKDEKEDLEIKSALLLSIKDDAELSMIVDLLRNDLGKVCEYGSVEVKEHKRLEAFTNVWHLFSVIEGKLRPAESYGSLLKACFPGGSITGCPKIRSMEIIDELEEYARNLYTGSIFIANDQRFDSNIVIRTVIAYKDMLHFHVGGAVVYDSVPEKEYEETFHKAQSILKTLGVK